MQEHSMTHIKTGIDFDCPVAFCSHQFSQHSTLRSHLDEAHNVCASSPASCKRCSLLFANSRRLLLHYQTRHDDTECGLVTLKKTDELPLKRKRALTSAVSPPHALPVCKKEFSPHQTDSSEKSSSPDLDQPTTCPITSEDLLIMCLNPALKFPTTSATNQLSIEQTMRFWANDSLAQCDPHSPSATSGVSQIKETLECTYCGISFFDETMHLLHKGLHTECDPWRCNLCGTQCMEKYMFTTHVIFASHST
ncbi:hypothetical protein KIN20_027311 [Parelaphostrongylus tenuis]|uniref:C2H2-type domain-containing protein n=1 Tax=Parelaphostrongylus tenuis TaxID=148309 RepID=A0AAD5QZ95_PARTN|nr:hypothetical protein KIN20_027311 [Parelaphostrongylus tenuis]